MIHTINWSMLSTPLTRSKPSKPRGLGGLGGPQRPCYLSYHLLFWPEYLHQCQATVDVISDVWGHYDLPDGDQNTRLLILPEHSTKFICFQPSITVLKQLWTNCRRCWATYANLLIKADERLVQLPVNLNEAQSMTCVVNYYYLLMYYCTYFYLTCYYLLLMFLLLHGYYNIITHYYIFHKYVLLPFLLLYCYCIIITYYCIFHFYILL